MRISVNNLYGYVSFILILFLTAGCTSQNNSTALDWPPVTQENKPWTYWWWPGSAVDRENLTGNLEELSRAGMGGVHIIPIYGVKGREDRDIPYLSLEWMEMLVHTVSEAKRLGMGVDMTSGTGWPFGGPHVGPENAASMVRIDTFELSGGERFEHSFTEGKLQAVVSFSENGRMLDLSDRIDRVKDTIRWEAPEGRWTVYAVVMEGTGQQVKRAAPGAEGNVMDYFSTASLNNYLARFDSAFTDYTAEPPRAFYNDSFEVYRSNWTENLFDEFQSRRGYDLREYIPNLIGKGEKDISARVRHDYNETISDLLLECFTIPWVNWSHGKGSRTRNQAHGSPGNLLDFYAAADIPETEAFGPSGFPIPGLRVDSNIPEHFGKPDILVQKFASSAAHVTGKPHVSSESCTWLGEHFQVSLSQVKPEIDALFVSGINHVFFHGMAYSPKDAPWPGWLFYASTNFAETGSFRKDLPALNAYIARCQSFLQSGKPDSDVLLYWPVHDRWREEADDDMLHHFQVHNADDWLHGTPFHTAAKTLWERGYTFDYISDRQISGVSASSGGFKTKGSGYRALVVPGCSYMPAGTLEKIIGLARNGATVIMAETLPIDVPGLGNLEIERSRFRKLKALIDFKEPLQAGIKQANVGKGRFLAGENLEKMLEAAGINREPVVDYGIEFIRRRHDTGYHYFLTNLNNKNVDDWVTLGVDALSAVIFDPVFNTKGIAAIRKDNNGATQVYLQLEPGQSCILKTFSSENIRGPKWSYLRESGEPVEITGQWRVTFIEGEPEIPQDFSTPRLTSWTETGEKNALSFHGTARYTIRFEKPEVEADEWILDIGKVCESAGVRLNGEYIGSLWCFPFRIRVGEFFKEGENVLEIDVTNLAANRIADLDRRGVGWKIFHDINYVNIKYEEFDASSWPPMESGLLGPVILLSLKKILE